MEIVPIVPAWLAWLAVGSAGMLAVASLALGLQAVLDLERD